MLTGRRKAAILCVSLGPEGAAEVFRHLPPDVMESLTAETARTREINQTDAEQVLAEAIEGAYARGFGNDGGVSYAREVLVRAVGERRAEEIIKRIATNVEGTPFDFLRSTPADQISTFLRGELPQTVALVLAHLPSADLAAKVMRELEPEDQADVAIRIATMDRTPPDVVNEVSRVMEERLESVIQQEYAAVGGVESLAGILNSSDRTTERNILDFLGKKDSDLAEEVRSRLFVFEDLLKLDDRTIQLVLKEVEAKDLALALRGASSDVTERILANMSSRGAEMLRDEMEFMPPQRRRVVEEAQSTVVAVVRRLDEAGAIVLSRGSDEDELVG